MVENASNHPAQARARRVGGMVAPEKVAAYARRKGVSLEEARTALEARAASLDVRREYR